MRCERIKDKIIGFVDGSLSERDSKEILQHIKECEVCRRELESVKEIFVSAKDIQVPQYDESFWQLNFEKIFEKAQQRKHRIVFLRRLRISIALVSVFLMLFVSRFYFQKNKPIEFINVPEVAHIPDEVLSEHFLPLPLDVAKNVLDILEPEDRIMLLAEYLH